MNQKGVTLVELLVTLLVASFIVAGVYRMVINSANAYAVQDAAAAAQDAARAGMEILVSDLRMAGYDRQNQAGGSVVTPNTPVSGGANGPPVPSD